MGDVLQRDPITGIAGCCARAASGHPAAAPPGSVNDFVAGLMKPQPRETALSGLEQESSDRNERGNYCRSTRGNVAVGVHFDRSIYLSHIGYCPDRRPRKRHTSQSLRAKGGLPRHLDDSHDYVCLIFAEDLAAAMFFGDRGCNVVRFGFQFPRFSGRFNFVAKRRLPDDQQRQEGAVRMRGFVRLSSR